MCVRALLLSFLAFSGKLIYKMSPLVLGEILEGFVNTLTFGGKYLLKNFENLRLPIQMSPLVLCDKRSLFSEVFARFLDSISNFEHFERKDDRHS